LPLALPARKLADIDSHQQGFPMTKLSPVERAILINQFKILGAVQGEADAYQHTIDVLSNGYELEYDDHIDGFGEPLPEEECQFVQNILWIYYLMKLAKNKTAVDNAGGDRDEGGRLRLENFEPKFPGFDGNDQPMHLGYAKHLIEKDGKFIEHKHYLNSHGSQPDYREMVELWQTWGSPSNLTEAQTDELLAAG
jgi:uncharacterized protein YfbU (UPF0304 family)